MKSIIKLVITGGPCAGKTTALSVVREKLAKLGYGVVFVSETATELIISGISPAILNKNIDFQQTLISIQQAKEKYYEEACQKIKGYDKVILIFDRTMLDNKAYLSECEFQMLLNKNNLNEIEVRDSYDAVFQLVTAANGAENYYTLANNSARTESIEEARALDKKITQAWAGHPHFRIIDNSTGFDDKIKRLMKEMLSFLGEPITFEIERKFLIKYPNINEISKLYPCKKSEIIQTYLKSNDKSEIRLRQRGLNGYYSFTKTIKKNIDGLKRIEIESKITKDEYLTLLMNVDDSRRQIRKTRYCFVYDSKYFELDIYPFWKDKTIIEVELIDENTEIKFPKEIEIIKEVTNDENYKNSSLAKLNNKIVGAK